MEKVDNNDNRDNYNNNGHIPIDIIISEKTETTWDEFLNINSVQEL